MINIDSFLATLSETRRRAQSAARANNVSATATHDLSPALELILEKGGLIQPQLARSPFAPRAARVGVPCGARAQIEFWCTCFGDDANWLLDTEASGMIALEFSPHLPPYLLFRRPGEYQAFEHTLRFDAHERIFALFSVPQGRRIARGWYHGLHWRTPVLIPPSRVLWGPGDEYEFELRYVDPSAPLLPAPETILWPPVRPY
jgi:hypothetical protein